MLRPCMSLFGCVRACVIGWRLRAFHHMNARAYVYIQAHCTQSHRHEVSLLCGWNIFSSIGNQSQRFYGHPNRIGIWHCNFGSRLKSCQDQKQRFKPILRILFSLSLSFPLSLIVEFVDFSRCLCRFFLYFSLFLACYSSINQSGFYIATRMFFLTIVCVLAHVENTQITNVSSEQNVYRWCLSKGSCRMHRRFTLGNNGMLAKCCAKCRSNTAACLSYIVRFYVRRYI